MTSRPRPAAAGDGARPARRGESQRSALDLVIVTGPHRSGTTFLGSVLAAADRTATVGVEPLNVTWGMRGVDEWYPEIRPGDHIDALMQRLRTGRRVGWNTPGDGGLDRVRAARRGWARNRRLATALKQDLVVVLKDPFLSLSLEYAVGSTSRPVTVAIRHPGAWSTSLQRVGWHPGGLLDTARDRPQLAPVAEAMGMPARNWGDASLLEASAWAWTLLVGAILRQTEALGRSVVVLPLERFEREPVETGLSLIREVGLEPGPDTRASIEALTLGTTTIPADTTTHVLQRDTRASLGAWRTVVSREERDAIWRIAGPVASRFYEP